MTAAEIQYVSDEEGKPTAVLVPIDLWREIAAEKETAYLMSSDAMRRRLLEGHASAQARQGWTLRIRRAAAATAAAALLGGAVGGAINPALAASLQRSISESFGEPVAELFEWLVPQVELPSAASGADRRAGCRRRTPWKARGPRSCLGDRRTGRCG